MREAIIAHDSLDKPAIIVMDGNGIGRGPLPGPLGEERRWTCGVTPRRFVVAWQASGLLRQRARSLGLRTAHGEGEGERGVRRPAVQRQNRRQRLRQRRRQASRVRHGVGRDDAGGIRPVLGGSVRSCPSLCISRRDHLCVHGLAAHGRNARRRRFGELRTFEPVRLGENQRRHGLALSIEA